MNTGLPGYCNKGIPVPRVLCHDLTEVTEVPGKGMGIYSTCRSSGHGYGSVTELTEVPGFVARAYRTHKFRAGIKMLYPYPGYLWHGHRAYRSFGYGYECRTELTEIPGTGMNVLQNLQKFFVG